MKNEQGFGMVEALIACTLFLVLMAATLGSLNDALGVNEKTNQMTDLEQNLRAGMNFMVQDFIQAGWQIPTGGVPIPSGAGAITVKRPSPPGTDFNFSPATTISAVNPGAGMGPVGVGQTTDIVNILYGDNLIWLNQYNLTALAADGSSVTVDARTRISGTGVDYPIVAGDLILFNNGQGNALQYVSRVTNQTMFFDPNDPLGLNQPAAPSGSITGIKAGGVFPPTTAMRVWLVTYYLDMTTNPTLPRLMRRVNDRPGQVVALVLEDLQLTYDLVDGVTNPTNVDSPTAPNSNNQIRKANVSLSGRSDVKVRNTNDYLHRTLTTQVGLRSLAFVNRYK
jgi:type II secretory pathway pseudopilin PulG